MTTPAPRHKQVEAIAHGTVIDHIPGAVTLKVAQLIAGPDDEVFIGANLRSTKLGRKGVVKISGRELSPDVISRLFVLAPQASMSIIRDYEVASKGPIPRPQEMQGVLACPNPNCVTNHENCATRFQVEGGNEPHFRCHYCERTFDRDEMAVG